MGQGAYLIINNTTEFPLTLVKIHSYQMNSWDHSMPAGLAPHSSGKFYIETNDFVGNANDTGADSYYAIGNTGEQLYIGYSQRYGRNLSTQMMAPTTHSLYPDPAGSLGWNHDGSVNVALRHGQAVGSNNWMKGIPDAVNLTELSIPGTHESCARVEPFPGTAKTQNLSLADQLNGGIRLFDIRCSVSDANTALLIFHGAQPTAVYQNMNFDDVLNAFDGFLKANPSETVLMRVRNEGENKGDIFPVLFDRYVKGQVDVHTRRPDLFLPDSMLPAGGFPTLGAARGRIVLLRNFDLPSPPPCMGGILYGDAAHFTIEDAYQVQSGSEKWGYVVKAIQDRAAAPKSDKFSLIYTSGYISAIFSIPDIPHVADYVNPRLAEWAGGAQIFAWGAFAMDFAALNTARSIYMTNRWLNL